MRVSGLPILLVYTNLALGQASPTGESAYRAFLEWRQLSDNRRLTWQDATSRYMAKLTAGGMRHEEAAKTISIIASRDEASLYDPIYRNAAPKFQTAPNKLLAEAVRHRKPGRALDVGMGQGRNAIHLAKLGWDVTGFDVAKAGLDQALKLAAQAGVKLKAVHASDEEFDFGKAQWDLIAILYPIEKRSVHRVRAALRPGGIVVVECAHKEAGGAAFEYDSNELLEIFAGFRILKYEDAVDEHEWARKPMRLVRIVAEK